MLILQITIFVILIAQLTSQQCGQGCQTCSSGQVPICLYCQHGYQLNQGSCIYSDCSPSLYFQTNSNQVDASVGNCSSICDPLFNTDEQTNTCKKLVQCSSIYSTQPNFLNPGIPTDFFIYNQSYYVALQQGYLSIYDKISSSLIKNLSYNQDDLNVLNVKGQIIVIKKDFSINIWDIINERRYEIDQTNLISINLQTQFISLLDNYLMVYQIEQQSYQFQVIYDFAQWNQTVSNQIQIKQSLQFNEIINNFLFLGNQTNIIVYQITFQTEKVILNFTQLTNFSFLNYGNILSIIQSTNSSVYFPIYTNAILKIDISGQTFSCLLQQTLIKKAKFIQFDNLSNDQHLIILNEQNLIDYNIISKQSNVILSEINFVTDFGIGNFSGINNQLIILSNQTIFEIYNIKSTNYEQIQIISLQFQSQSLKQMPISYNSKQLEYETNFEIAFFSTFSIQIIKESNLQNQFLETIIIENFNLPFPTPNSKINSLTYVYSPQLLVSCHQNGDIIFYDASKQSDINLIRRLRFSNQVCYMLQIFSDNKIAAQIGQNIYLIDPSQQIVLNQFTNLVNIIQITSNQDKLAINYNNCLQIISSNFVSLFLECQTDFSSNNINIALNNDLKIYLQKQSQLYVYQIDLIGQGVQLLYQLSTQYPIQYFTTVNIFKTDQDTISNNYFIDEIVYFDTSFNFNICSVSLQITYTIQINLINNLISAKRVINDASVYFLAGYQPASGMYRVFLVSKSLAYFIQFSTIPYLPIIDYPKKIVNGYGTVLYTINRSIVLSFFTLYKDYQIDINKNITYITGHEYLNNDKQSASQNKMVGSTLNYVSYIGTNSGLVYTAKIQKSRYQEVMTKQILSPNKNNDQILEIIQSSYLGIYFTRTKYQISSFNIFTNNFIEYLTPQSSNDPPFTSFGLVLNNKGIICWNQNQVLYATYGKTPQKYYFKGMIVINGWIFDKSSNNFYIYGSSFQLLNSQMKTLQTVPELYQNKSFIQCQDASQIMICSLSLNQFVIVKKLLNQFTFQSVQVNGFTTQYLISVDEQYKNIFLYNQQIQVYNFNGIYIVGYKLNTLFISFSIAASRLMFQSQQYIYFVERDTLNLQQNFIQAPSGLFITKYIYVEFLKKIIITTNMGVFAQIYIYDSGSLQNIAKINGSFPSNLLGDVVDLYFDYSCAQIFYLDTYGNIYVYYLYADFPVQSNYKITEVNDRNEILVGLSYDNVTNNILIYSTQSVYQIDYTLSGIEYESQLNEPNNIQTTIPTNNNSLEFLIFNSDNVMFRYSKYNINFENIINGSQIVDCLYNFDYDILIIAQKDQILFYHNYQNSNNNNKIPVTIVLKQIQFFKFLNYNIYITYDKKIIYCNILSGEIIDFAQLQPSLIVTQHLFSQDHITIFIGLSNGQVLLYNLSDLSKQYISFQNNIQIINTSIISIVFDESQQNQILYFVSNGGMLQIFDVLNKKPIQQINLVSLVNEEPSIILKEFTIDFTYSRYIYHFNGQKKAYVWNFSTNYIEKYLAFTKDQGNRLQIIQNYIITFSTIQLNIYSLSEEISLITFIKRDQSKDQITDYKVINNNIILVFFIQKYEVFLLQNNTNSLIYQQQFNYPRYLGSIYNQESNILTLYGLHQTGVFENNFSISLYDNDQQFECSIVISDKDISQLNRKISNISPKQNVIYTTLGTSTTNQQNWQNLIYLQLTNDQFLGVNEYIYQNQITNSKYLFYPQISNNNLTINNQTFNYYQETTLQMFNYNLIFQTDDQQTLITLNQNIQNIIWQNIGINSQCINNIQFNITNIKKVIFKQLNISKLLACSNSSNNSQFFNFADIEQIFIYDLEISEAELNLNQNVTLFNFKNIQNIFIKGVQISNNQNLKSIFQFTEVNNITLSNIKINNNQNINKKSNLMSRLLQQQVQEQTFQSDYALNFFGCQQVFINNSTFQNNSQLLLIQSLNQYIQNDQLTVLYNDIFKLANLDISSNQNPNLTNSHLHSPDNQNSFTKHSYSNFKLVSYNQYTDDGNPTLKNDFIIEADNNLIADEQETRNLQIYNFRTKSSSKNTKQLNI
ncbi:hypothetical protein ABPG73_007991 [Tetrahymena malaccensis]